MDRRNTSLFGTKPGILWWNRGGDREFVSARGSAKSAMSDLLQYVMPTRVAERDAANFISLPGTTRYEPLVDTPKLYLGFRVLGEKVWADPTPSIPELAELALEFTREYGSLESGTRLTLKDIIEEAKTVAWLVKGSLAVGGDNEAAELFWQRGIAKHGEAIARFRGTQLPPGSAELRRIIASIIGTVTNQHLKVHSVWTQIQTVLGDPTQQPGFEPTYEPASLRGAIWAQFASSLMRESVLRRCKFEKCGEIFEAPNPASRLKYCPPLDPDKDGCQVKANDQKKYLKRVAAKAKGN